MRKYYARFTIILLLNTIIIGAFNVSLLNAYNQEYSVVIEPYSTNKINFTVNTLALVTIKTTCEDSTKHFNYSIFKGSDHSPLGFRLNVSSTSKFFFIGEGDYSVIFGNLMDESITVSTYIDSNPIKATDIDGKYTFTETGDFLYYFTLSSEKTLLVDLSKKTYITTTFFVLENDSLCNIGVYYQDPALSYFPDESYKVRQEGLTAYIDFSSTPSYLVLSPRHPLPLTLIIIFEIPVKGAMSLLDIFIIVGLVFVTGTFCGFREKKKRTKRLSGSSGAFSEEEVLKQSYLAATSMDMRNHVFIPYVPPVVREVKKKKKLESEK